ncbi:hypothetical protein HY745_15325 [Candidatus Desantisbacteria bacterium]|nr:hypothetical protein [Candidatus Desantisbacteria bacterium]
MIKKITLITALLLIFAYGQISASTVEIIGDDGNPEWSGAATGKSKGNVLGVYSDVNLEEMEFLLNFTGQKTLSFYLYESNSPTGMYSKIYQNNVTLSGAGKTFYGSGPISGVTLFEGGYYYSAVSWTGSGLTYYYEDYLTIPEMTSFAVCIQPGRYFTPLADPLNIADNTVNKGVFTERFTTSPFQGEGEGVVPEPMSAVFLVTGGLFLAGVKRLKRS